MEEKYKIWKNLNGIAYSESIQDLLEDAICRELSAGHELKVCIGSDSHVYGNEVNYATAIVVVRKGKGAFAFLHTERVKEKISLKERLLNEVARSVEVTYSVCSILDLYHIELEVHADINSAEDHKSNLVLKEAMGYVLGMGYTFIAKPYAFASSSCADWVA